MGPKSYRIRRNSAKYGPLRRSRSFKVTDFGTNRKPIYDFLLVNNTNLPPILHCFGDTADHFSNFRYRQGSLYFNALAGVPSCEYRDKIYLSRNYTVFQKSEAKIQITITTAYLTRIKYPLSGFNYHLSDVNFTDFNKIHRTVSEQQLF